MNTEYRFNFDSRCKNYDYKNCQRGKIAIIMNEIVLKSSKHSLSESSTFEKYDKLHSHLIGQCDRKLSKYTNYVLEEIL